ncbi:hypothetical protein FOPE_04886 [Fonsecaea pedrosoi]|nr:hypothetical protein FOPE_04886 [Fonsecaea pedrosoi]
MESIASEPYRHKLYPEVEIVLVLIGPRAIFATGFPPFAIWVPMDWSLSKEPSQMWNLDTKRLLGTSPSSSNRRRGRAMSGGLGQSERL